MIKDLKNKLLRNYPFFIVKRKNIVLLSYRYKIPHLMARNILYIEMHSYIRVCYEKHMFYENKHSL